MKKPKSFVKSALTLQCPHCRNASMFVNPPLYTLHNLGSVKPVCGNCGVNLSPESGFYFGAAYVSWALTVVLWVAILIALQVLDGLGVIVYSFFTHPSTFLFTGASATLLLFPYMFRLSRSLWAHFHIRYRRALSN